MMDATAAITTPMICGVPHTIGVENVSLYDTIAWNAKK
jgi:hypothetical protein